MADRERLEEKIRELEGRKWDTAGIEKRIKTLIADGILGKRFERDKLRADKEEVLDRVQCRAEEYNFFLKNCAQGTALALMEEFGLGNMEIVTALTAFPAIGGTGEVCGGVTGALVAFGLYFGGKGIPDEKATGAVMMTSQRFITLFRDKIGHTACREIQENVIFGRNMDPGTSRENMEAFARAKGFEKCGLPPGIGARTAAELLIEEQLQFS
ncbi:MAG: C_GCAxxG_C_C family protein [Deltaproteobacteria bacterium]|nr:C_GCAxxG_C_C family protein [Deltaproteobacteria bacterium]